MMSLAPPSVEVAISSQDSRFNEPRVTTKHVRFINLSPRAIDHTGKRFGKIVALGPVERRVFGNYATVMWLCQCDCGNLTQAQVGHLVSGRHQSCGCVRLEKAGANLRTHNHTGSPEWHTWRGMKQRCENPKHKAFPRYGGRGITVCERWRADFLNFLEDMGERPSPAHELDREDNDGNYDSDNCRWVLRPVNNRNRSTTRKLTAFGRTRYVLEWAEDLGIDPRTLRARLDRGWSPEDAVSVYKLKLGDQNRKGAVHYSRKP